MSDSPPSVQTPSKEEGGEGEEEKSKKTKDDHGEEGGSDDDDEDKDEDDNNNDDPMILLTKALTFKEEGNQQFQKQEYTKASRSYKKGINLIKHLHSSYKKDTKGNSSSSDNDDEQITALLISLNSNLSMVLYKQKNYDQSKSIATHIITKLDSKNSKAFYRRGLCYKQLSNYFSSKSDLYKAYQLLSEGGDSGASNNKEKNAIRKEYNEVKKIYEARAVKSDEKQKKALAKVFSSTNDGKSGKKNGGSLGLLYDDKEEEMKKKELQKQEEKRRKKELREKRKLEWEKDCVERLANGEDQKDIPSFEEYEKNIEKQEKQEEEKRKKLKKEQEDLERRRRKEERKKNAKDDDTSDDEDEILTESELKSLRGYKKTSDGRTTSYFSREQTEEEKKLLGSIAPQKLDPSTAAVASAGAGASLCNSSHLPQRLDSSLSSSSAWNQAGTWEERDTSEWCNTQLENFLRQSKVTCSTSDTPTFHGSITKVKDLKGEASVAFVSGKKRYVFDYNTSLNYEISIEKPCDSSDVDGNNQEMTEKDNEKKTSVVVIAKGSLHLPDISSASISDEEIEVQTMKWKKEPSESYKEDAMGCRKVLIEKIRENVLAFVSAFNSEY